MKRVQLLLLALLLSVSGCGTIILAGAGAAAGIAGFKFYKGSLTVIYKSSFEKTWTASINTLQQMNVVIEKQEHSLTSGSIWGKFSDGRSVHIALKYRAASETEATIRVGALGDEEASMVLQERIRKTLFEDG